MPMTHLVFVKGEYNTILLFIITNSFCFYTMKVLEMVESSQGQGQSMLLMSKNASNKVQITCYKMAYLNLDMDIVHKWYTLGKKNNWSLIGNQFSGIGRKETFLMGLTIRGHKFKPWHKLG